MGRSATVNGNGRAVYPPGVQTTMQRYRQPERPGRDAWGVVRTVVLWTALVAVIVAGGVAGAAYLKTHQFIAAISPKTKVDIAAAKHLDVAIPGQPTTALVIGTDRRKGSQAELTGRSDTLILIRADPQTKSLSMLSFPRDLIATLKCPGHPDLSRPDQRRFLRVRDAWRRRDGAGPHGAPDQLFRHGQLHAASMISSTTSAGSGSTSTIDISAIRPTVPAFPRSTCSRAIRG